MAVLQRIDDLRLVTAAESKGALLIEMLRGAVGRHQHVGDVRGLGLLIAVELVEERAPKKPFPRTADAAGQLARNARRLGLLVYPSTGTAGDGLSDVVLIGPPLIINDAELDALVSRFSQALHGLG